MFRSHIDTNISERQKQLTVDFKVRPLILNTLLFTDNQVLLAQREDTYQIAIQQLIGIASIYSSEIHSKNAKIKLMSSSMFKYNGK
jgi:hypothetical protein